MIYIQGRSFTLEGSTLILYLRIIKRPEIIKFHNFRNSHLFLIIFSLFSYERPIHFSERREDPSIAASSFLSEEHFFLIAKENLEFFCNS